MDSSAPQEEPYVTTWNLYLKKSSYTRAMTDFVQEVATHVTKKIGPDHLRRNPVFRVLGVGSGKGKTDLRILTGVATVLGESPQIKKPSIQTVVVEPSKEMIAQFKTSTTPLPQPLQSSADVSFEWYEMTLEKFIESFPKMDSFNIIHFVASLYYMDAETSLQSCYKKLSPGGAIFCTVGTEKSFFPQISKELHDSKIDLGSAQKLYSEVDVVDIATRNNWKYEKLWKAQYNADISSCFDESSKEGSILLDFLTDQRDFRTTADKTFYKKAMDFLNNVSTTDDTGRKVIQREMTAVVIYK